MRKDKPNAGLYEALPSFFSFLMNSRGRPEPSKPHLRRQTECAGSCHHAAYRHSFGSADCRRRCGNRLPADRIARPSPNPGVPSDERVVEHSRKTDARPVKKRSKRPSFDVQTLKGMVANHPRV
ncbi:hypothetical protein MTO96_010097 [Rhipicephalus appendiculatus]